MRFFACVMRPSGAPVSEDVLAQFTTAKCCRDLDLTWREVGGLWTLIHTDEVGFGAEVARWGSFVGIGMVRLDNRDELVRWTGSTDTGVTDLELVLRLLALDGDRRIRDILGDFAFVMLDTPTRTIAAARDAFGVKTLYCVQRSDLIAFASRAELLKSGDEYDLEYLTALVAKASPPPDRTAYAGVDAVPAASAIRFQDGQRTVRRYWSAAEFEPEEMSARAAHDLCEEFRGLHIQAVRLRVTHGPETCSMLSGGLDSSSNASIVQWLANTGAIPYGLAGTVTWVDTRGTGADEREYSDAVVRHYQLRNDKIFDIGYLHDDGEEPPLVDQPQYNYPFYARDRRTCDVVRASGGRVLLSGYGGDHIVMGNMFFFSDWIAAGRVRRALDEMLRRAALGRASFWQLAYRNAFLPLMPRQLQHVLVGEHRAPTWINPTMIKRYDLAIRVMGVRAYGGRIGRKYAHYVADAVSGIPSELTMLNVLSEKVEMRHPYLYRPLVEFALRLPPEMCVQPNARKWVLREAMRGILPEEVRTRVGKGTLTGTVAWSVAHKRDKIEHVLRNPILAQLGCIDNRQLLAAVRGAHGSNSEVNLDIGATIAIETWLQVRSGQWSAGGRRTCNTSRNSSRNHNSSRTMPAHGM